MAGINSRMGKAKAAFQKMKSTLCNKVLSLHVIKRALKCYNKPVLYGCVSWNVNEQIKKNLRGKGDVLS